MSRNILWSSLSVSLFKQSLCYWLSRLFLNQYIFVLINIPLKNITLANSVCPRSFSWGKLTGVKLLFISLAKMSSRKIVSIHPAGGSAWDALSLYLYPHQKASVLLSTLNIFYSMGDRGGCFTGLNFASLNITGLLGICDSSWWIPCSFAHFSIEAFIFLVSICKSSAFLF